MTPEAKDPEKVASGLSILAGTVWRVAMELEYSGEDEWVAYLDDWGRRLDYTARDLRGIPTVEKLAATARESDA